MMQAHVACWCHFFQLSLLFVVIINIDKDIWMPQVNSLSVYYHDSHVLTLLIFE